jgi:hypothetical protein
MKWLVLAAFAPAFVTSLMYLSAGERKLPRSQQMTLGIAALAGWALVLLLGSTIL